MPKHRWQSCGWRYLKRFKFVLCVRDTLLLGFLLTVFADVIYLSFLSSCFEFLCNPLKEDYAAGDLKGLALSGLSTYLALCLAAVRRDE